MARLPIPGSDLDLWGDILNDFLRAAHHDDGTLRDAVRCVPSIAALRLLNPAGSDCACVEGYSNPGDGGGGPFVWTTDTVPADDGGTVIVSSSTPRQGCWKRVYQGAALPKWFNAAEDGVANDDLPMQAAINTGAGVALRPGKKYLIGKTNLDFTSGLDVGLGQLKPAAGVTLTLRAPLKPSMKAWIDLSLGGTVAFGPGTVTTVFPQWWGARGDIPDDDTTAIQANTTAIQAAIDASPPAGEVFLPAGRYLLSSPLHLRGNVTLRGAGAYITLLTQTKPVDVVTIHAAGGTLPFLVQGLMIGGGNIGIHVVPGKDSHGHDINYMSRDSSFRDLHFQDQRKAGLYIEAGMIGCAHSNLSFEMTGCEYGIYSSGGDLLGETIWHSVRVAGATVVGVLFAETTLQETQVGITMVNPILEYNQGVGLRLVGVEAQLINAHFEGNGGAAFDAYPVGTPDIDLHWLGVEPDGEPYAMPKVTLINGVFSTPGNKQSYDYDADHLPPSGNPTYCRIWGNGGFVVEIGTRHFGDDRLDSPGPVPPGGAGGQGNALDFTFMNVVSPAVVYGPVQFYLSFYKFKVANFGSDLDRLGCRIGFFNKALNTVPQQSATDLAGVISALKAYGLLKA